MPSSPSSPARADLRVRPSLGLAVLIGAITLLSLAAVQFAGLPIFLAIVLSLMALAVGGVWIKRLLRPALRIRLMNGAVEYRVDKHSRWQRLDPAAACFVSPWYVGWRSRGGWGYGVFRGQLAADEFRRLAVCLRNQKRG